MIGGDRAVDRVSVRKVVSLGDLEGSVRGSGLQGRADKAGRSKEIAEVGHHFLGGSRLAFFIVVSREEGSTILLPVLHEYVVDAGSGLLLVRSSEDSEPGCIFC